MYRPFDIVIPTKEYFEWEATERKLFSTMVNMTPNTLEDENEKYNNCKIIGMITETNGNQASVHWFNNDEIFQLKNAWWAKGELKVIDNAMFAIADNMSHPFGNNKKQSELFNKK